MKIAKNVGKMRILVRTDLHLGNVDSGVVEYGQRNRQIFNDRFGHEKGMCQNRPTDSASFQPENKYQCLYFLHTHQILLHVTFLFPKIEMFVKRNPFSFSCRHP
jgi:hypothetical protein